MMPEPTFDELADRFSPFFGGPDPGEDPPQEESSSEENLPIEGSPIPPGFTGPTEEEPPPTEESLVTLPSGRQLSVDKLNQLADFDEFITSNPLAWQRVQSALMAPPVLPPQEQAGAVPAPTGTSSPVGAGSPIPEPPAELLEDPSFRYLYEQNRSIHEQLAQQQRYAQDERERNAKAALTTATSRIQSEFSLDDNQMERLSWALANNGYAPAFLSANPMDPVGQLEQAFRATFFQDPSFRDQYMERKAQSNQSRTTTEKSRTRKLSSVAGSGSATPPPEPPAPRNRQERTEAIARAIAQQRAGS